MGRVGSAEFLKDDNYKSMVANATLAEKTKMDAIINWYEAETWEDALKLSKERCNKTDIEYGLRQENKFKGNFVSENNAMLAIAKIAELTPEESKQFINEFYTRNSFSEDLRNKISSAFKANPEEKLIMVLRRIHVSWDIDQSDKFQMWNNKKSKARNTEHQFDDLLLMQFGEDGATADKLFVDTILSDLGITIDENKLKDVFINEQKMYLNYIMEKYGEETKDNHSALVKYLQNGEYLAKCEEIAGKELTTTATAIKEDKSRAEHSEKWEKLDTVSIRKLLAEDSIVADSMASLIEAQVRFNGIDFSILHGDRQSPNDDGQR